MNFGRFTEFHMLRSIGRELLADFAAKFEAELVKNNVVLPPKDESTIEYFEAWVSLLMSPDKLPDRMNDALHAIHELSTPKGHERVKKMILDYNLRLAYDETNTPEEIALRVWLQEPELVAKKYNEVQLGRLSRFDYYQTTANLDERVAKSVLIHEDMGFMDNLRDMSALIYALNQWYSDNDRGQDTAVVYKYDINGEEWYLIRHGDTLTRAAKVEKRQIEIFHYRPAKDDVVVYSPKRDELRINARTKSEKELYRTAFGAYLKEDNEYFKVAKSLTLIPLLEDGKRAMKCYDIDGLYKVVLTKLDLALRNGMNQGYTFYADDVFECHWMGAREKGLIIPPGAKLLRAGFQIYVKGYTKPLELQIQPPDTLRMARNDAEDLVHEWLTERQFKCVNNPNNFDEYD